MNKFSLIVILGWGSIGVIWGIDFVEEGGIPNISMVIASIVVIIQELRIIGEREDQK